MVQLHQSCPGASKTIVEPCPLNVGDEHVSDRLAVPYLTAGLSRGLHLIFHSTFPANSFNGKSFLQGRNRTKQILKGKFGLSASNRPSSFLPPPLGCGMITFVRHCAWWVRLCRKSLTASSGSSFCNWVLLFPFNFFHSRRAETMHTGPGAWQHTLLYLHDK